MAATETRERLSPAVRAAAIAIPVLAVVVGAWLVIGRLRDRHDAVVLDQSSPQAVLQTANRLIETGQARRLPDLVYADSDQVRGLYNRLGGLMGAVQEAGFAAAEAFPSDIERLRARAAQAVEEGRAQPLLGRLLNSAGGRGRGGPLAGRGESDDPMADFVGGLLADPYGWYHRHSERLGIVPMTERSVLVAWDGKPVLQPFGLVIQEDYDGKWYLMLPTSLPPVRQFIEADSQQLEMIGLIILCAENAFRDLAADMRAGKIDNLDHAANKLGEYIMPTVGLGMIAMERYRQEKRREQRARREREGPAG